MHCSQFRPLILLVFIFRFFNFSLLSRRTFSPALLPPIGLYRLKSVGLSDKLPLERWVGGLRFINYEKNSSTLQPSPGWDMGISDHIGRVSGPVLCYVAS